MKQSNYLAYVPITSTLIGAAIFYGPYVDARVILYITDLFTKISKKDTRRQDNIGYSVSFIAAHAEVTDNND